MKKEILQTVVETPEFIKQAKHCMDKVSWNGFIDYIAGNPLAGDLIVGTGGARKVRWTGDHNKGKSGGSRVIYHYHDQSMPIFLFTVFGKSQRANLSSAERNILKEIIKQIVKQYKGDEYE